MRGGLRKYTDVHGGSQLGTLDFRGIYVYEISVRVGPLEPYSSRKYTTHLLPVAASLITAALTSETDITSIRLYHARSHHGFLTLDALVYFANKTQMQSKLYFTRGLGQSAYSSPLVAHALYA